MRESMPANRYINAVPSLWQAHIFGFQRWFVCSPNFWTRHVVQCKQLAVKKRVAFNPLPQAYSKNCRYDETPWTGSSRILHFHVWTCTQVDERIKSQCNLLKLQSKRCNWKVSGVRTICNPAFKLQRSVYIFHLPLFERGSVPLKVARLATNTDTSLKELTRAPRSSVHRHQAMTYQRNPQGSTADSISDHGWESLLVVAFCPLEWEAHRLPFEENLCCCVSLCWGM